MVIEWIVVIVVIELIEGNSRNEWMKWNEMQWNEMKWNEMKWMNERMNDWMNG